ncbi:hypothetical protein GGH95_006572, partial [Coemansia sp. RSA 1836]
ADDDDAAAAAAGRWRRRQLEEEEKEAESMMERVLWLALEVVLQNMARQLCLIAPPLSAHGRQQLAADVDYVASVAASFTAAALASEEFGEIARALKPGSADDADDADAGGSGSAAAVAVRAKMRVLLADD